MSFHLFRYSAIYFNAVLNFLLLGCRHTDTSCTYILSLTTCWTHLLASLISCGIHRIFPIKDYVILKEEIALFLPSRHGWFLFILSHNCWNSSTILNSEGKNKCSLLLVNFYRWSKINLRRLRLVLLIICNIDVQLFYHHLLKQS
jgi:hypothetical protein